MIYISYYKSQIGEILLASKNKKLIGLWIEGQNPNLSDFKDKIIKKDDEEIIVKVKEWLNKYFNKEKPLIEDLPLNPIGSEFRKKVWKILCKIPYGETITYGDIAKEIGKSEGKKMSAQAVGGAVGHNPISIIIPCHRVVGTNGNLIGYGGGLDLKIKLLKLENVNMKDYYLP